MTTDDFEPKRDLNELELETFKKMAQDILGDRDVTKKIKDMIGKNNRLTLNIDDIRRKEAGLAEFLIKNPLSGIRMFEDLLNA